MLLKNKERLKTILTGIVLGVVMISGSAYIYPATTSSHTKVLSIQQQTSVVFHVKTMAYQEIKQLSHMQAAANKIEQAVQLSLNGEQQMKQAMQTTSHVIHQLATHPSKNPNQSETIHSTVHQIRQESFEVQGQSQIVMIHLSQWLTALKKWQMINRQIHQTFTLYTHDMQTLDSLSHSTRVTPIPHNQQMVIQSSAQRFAQEVSTRHHDLILQKNILKQANAILKTVMQRFS
jgi:hypothetical protein